MTQRLRTWYSRGEAAKELPNSDLMRAWGNAFEKAAKALGQPLPQKPRLIAAAYLGPGMTSDGEIFDAFVEQPLEVRQLRGMLRPPAPGITLLRIEEVGLGLPSLQ